MRFPLQHNTAHISTSRSVPTVATLKENFLDRLAEVLAREKSSPTAYRMKGSRHKIDAQHVAAAAWLDYPDDKKVIILVAKNHGLDEADSKMLSLLERWLQCIAKMQRRPRIDGDIVWFGRAGTTGLLDYYRVRLEYYISTIQAYADDRVPASTASTESTDEKIHQLIALCMGYNNDQASAYQRHEIVTLAYELRYEDFQRSCTLAKDSDKLMKPVYMLGRLRAAYETFKEAAVHFKALANVEIKRITPPEAKQYPVRRLKQSMATLASNHKLRLPVETLGVKNFKKNQMVHIHVHVEVQVFLHLEVMIEPHQQAHSYISCSKKSCWLCHDLLTKFKSRRSAIARYYETRESHGQVHPFWTISDCSVSGP